MVLLHVPVLAMEGRSAAAGFCHSLVLPSGSLDNAVSLSLPCESGVWAKVAPGGEPALSLSRTSSGTMQPV